MNEPKNKPTVIVDDHLIRAFERLPPRRQKMILRAQARQIEKGQRTQPEPVSGYVCVKCRSWLPTPEARKACRESHHGT